MDLDQTPSPERAAAHEFIHGDPVRLVDGAPALLFSLASQPVLLRHGEWTRFLPGWRALFVFSGFAPTLVMQLAHENKARAVWYLDIDGRRLADTVSALRASDRASLQQAAGPVLGEMVRALLQDPHPVLHPAARGFLALDEACRLQLLELCRDRLVAGPLALLDVSEGGAPNLPATLQPSLLLDLLGLDLQAMLPEIAASGVFAVRSPATGETITAQGSLCIDDFHFAYRFTDAGTGLVFYLIAGHEHSEIYAVYLPRAGLLLHGR